MRITFIIKNQRRFSAAELQTGVNNHQKKPAHAPAVLHQAVNQRRQGNQSHHQDEDIA